MKRKICFRIARRIVWRKSLIAAIAFLLFILSGLVCLPVLAGGIPEPQMRERGWGFTCPNCGKRNYTEGPMPASPRCKYCGAPLYGDASSRGGKSAWPRLQSDLNKKWQRWIEMDEKQRNALFKKQQAIWAEQARLAEKRAQEESIKLKPIQESNAEQRDDEFTRERDEALRLGNLGGLGTQNPFINPYAGNPNTVDLSDISLRTAVVPLLRNPNSPGDWSAPGEPVIDNRSYLAIAIDNNAKRYEDFLEKNKGNANVADIIEYNQNSLADYINGRKEYAEFMKREHYTPDAYTATADFGWFGFNIGEINRAEKGWKWDPDVHVGKIITVSHNGTIEGSFQGMGISSKSISIYGFKFNINTFDDYERKFEQWYLHRLKTSK